MSPPPPDPAVADALARIGEARTLEAVHRIVSEVSAASPTPDIVLYTAGARASDAGRAKDKRPGRSLITDTERAALLNEPAFLAKIGQFAGMDAFDPIACADKITDRELKESDPEYQAVLLARELLLGRAGDPQSLKDSFWGRASAEFVRSAAGDVMLLLGDDAAREKRVFWAVELPALLENPGERRINGTPAAALHGNPDIAFEQLRPEARACTTGFGDPRELVMPVGMAGGGTGGGGGGGGAGLPAARIGDMHACPMVTVLVPHVGGPVALGCPTVLVGGMPAARVGDMAVCTGPPDVIALGSFTVLVGGMPAARLGDMTAHGGVIVAGLPTVMIG